MRLQLFLNNHRASANKSHTVYFGVPLTAKTIEPTVGQKICKQSVDLLKEI